MSKKKISKDNPEPICHKHCVTPSTEFVTDSPWRVAKSLLRLRDQINAMAPQRSKASDGTIGDEHHQQENSDHNPWVKDGQIGVVTAIDITEDSVHGCSCENIVSALVASKDVRIKYLIYKRQIISSQVQPWVWRKYTKADPHTSHFHVSVLPTKKLYDSEIDWHIK